MTKTKKSLLMSALSLLLCISMLIGSTFAWFTDSVTSAVNKIQSGTLKVDLELLDKETGKWNSLKESQAPIFNYDKWEPGYIDTKVLKVENEGNLALKWVAKFYSEYQLSILADVIDVYVRPSDSEIDYPTDRNLVGYTCVGNLRTFINSIEETTYGTLEAKEVSYLGLALKMREEAGNEYQGLSLGGAFDIRIFATQHTSEADSFDNQYDKNSLFDGFVDKSILTSQGKYLNDGADSVNFSIYHKGVKIVAVSVPESAIANKDKPITVTIRAIDSYIAAGENTQSYAYDIDVTNLKSNLKGDQLVTVVVAAPKGLASIKAYHKNELLTDAVYDEVAGTITFKTASFSPFEFTTQVYEVEDLEGLRKLLENNEKNTGAYVKLKKDIIINLNKDVINNKASDRSDAHVLVSGKNTYFNAVNIVSQDVAIDLNGHSITVFCGPDVNDNGDVGALFFVGQNGSLNITNTGDVSTGFIKMESSIYAVWAPYADPSYVDIYSGAFIADSYAGDPVGTSTDPDSEDGTMSNEQENANRALIYAGTGGNINVYGGYFLYNNTVNDISNRNNGAFNAKDYYEDGALITIHEGVYLSNENYRQDPPRQNGASFDDYSVVLSQYAQDPIGPITESITIAGQTYSTWYKVAPKYAYKVVFKSESSSIDNLDTYYAESNTADLSIDTIDDIAFGKLDDSYKKDFGGWVTAGSKRIETIYKDDPPKDYILYPSHKQKITVRFVDQNGNILKETKLAQGDTVTDDLKPSDSDFPVVEGFDGKWPDDWKTKVQEALNNNEDITIYPTYTLNTTEYNLDLIPVDEDGDGKTDHYAVVGSNFANGAVDFEIPDYLNGVPVEEIRTGAFADGKLRDVVIPKSVKSIGENAFCADKNYSSIFNPGEYPQIQIIFEGTRAEWDAISKDSGWDDNIGSDSVIICTKEDPIGYYEQAGSNPTLWNGGKTSIAWNWVSGTPDWYPRNYD